MIKGSCFWFYRVNKDESKLRFCRDGSLCKYVHLTQEETNLIHQKGSQQEPCSTCKGSKYQTFNWVIQGVEKPCNVTCLSCNGSGETLIRDKVLSKARDRLWCKCKKSRDSTYYPDNTHPRCSKHCYVCVDCKGITQTG